MFDSCKQQIAIQIQWQRTDGDDDANEECETHRKPVEKQINILQESFTQDTFFNFVSNEP